MSYQFDRHTGELIIGGFEKGIGPSPHKGIANIQNANISTESGEILASYGRVQQSQTVSVATGSVSAIDSSHIFLGGNISTVNPGMWINISGSTISGLSDGVYYVLSNANFSSAQISSYYNGTTVTGMGSTGTASFTLFRNIGSPVASCTETYSDGTTVQYRYYILDANGLVWVYDTAYATGFDAAHSLTWFLPDFHTDYFGSDTAPTSIGVLNGWLFTISGNKIWTKSTVNLGGSTSTSTTWSQVDNAYLNGLAANTNPHSILVGHQGKLYYTDSNYIGSIFPNTSLLTDVANIQSYCSFTASGTTGTLSAVIGGSRPTTGLDVGVTGFSRIPAVFFTRQGGSIPSSMTAGQVYYISFSLSTANFTVYDALTGGSAKDISTGASGTQYFNTFYPIGSHAGILGDASTVTYSSQRVNLPFYEVAQCMAEIGNTVVIGTVSNTVYPWNQIDPTPSSIISLPESNTKNIITVNQMAYIFAGNKGNVYITDGSVASLVIKVPDYCAGVPGTPSSYIEPYFTWGGAMYLRGRVYFSILDQTSTKAGNCGGIWSFVPTQNLYIGQDTGLALRLENQNSYGTYNGVATVLLPSQNQAAISPQYWSGWYSSVTSATYGIDFTNTVPVTTYIVETDVVPTGYLLGNQKETYSSIEYKVASPMASGDSIAIKYRQNATDSWTSAGSVSTEGTGSLTGAISPLSFAQGDWVQLQLTATSSGSTSSSYVRLTEVRLRTK